MTFLLLHSGDVPLWFWLIPAFIMLLVAVGFAVLLSLLLKKLLTRGEPRRRPRQDHPEE